MRSCIENVWGAAANCVCRRRHHTAQILSRHIFVMVYSNVSSALTLCQTLRPLLKQF